jgi:hypothetical protein
MAQEAVILAHWHLLLDDFATSPKEFYAAVEQALSDRQVPSIKTVRIDTSEGGLFSAKREYLRVIKDDLTFDICAAPYGTSFFFSSWLVTKPGCLTALPYVGVLFNFLVKGVTYFVMDTRIMFQESVHRAVTGTIDSMRTAKGLRALTPEEAKPGLSKIAG